MLHPSPEGAWRKSSYSSDANGSCLEWRRPHTAAVAVRDSKEPARGAFRFSAGAWAAFVGGIRAGHFGG